MMYNLFLFGTGNGCKDIELIIDKNKCNLIGYIDNDKSKQQKLINNKKVISINDLENYEYDFIIITVASQGADEILEQLLQKGVQKEKIICPFMPYSKRVNDSLNNQYSALSNISINKIENFYLCNMIRLGRERLLKDSEMIGDYVRKSSLELIVNEVYDKKVKGSIAELGVYRGDFAAIINKLFYDRKLYLFDTFEGFNENDIKIDSNQKYSISNKSDFSNTNIDIVMSKMVNKNNCVIRKGYFPETAKDVDDTFAFVSIDVDLFKPIYDGLVYFYSRLEQGGYIFVHDYNNATYKGSKEAVRKFCSENNINYFPLSDFGGSAVITK